MVEVDAVEDLVEFAKIERSGGTVPQLTKPGRAVRVGPVSSWPNIASGPTSYQILPNSPACNEASCVHQVSHFSLDAVKTVRGGLSACDTDPTQHAHTLRLQRVIRASAPSRITPCQCRWWRTCWQECRCEGEACNRIQGPPMVIMPDCYWHCW